MNDADASPSAHPAALVHFAELTLKGKNRPFFESRLFAELRGRLVGHGARCVRRVYGRLVIDFDSEESARASADRLSKVFGISYWALGWSVERDYDRLEELVLDRVVGRDARTFAIRARRADKNFPMSSADLQVRLGHRVGEATGWKVDLDAPDVRIHVEILFREIFVYLERHRGLGGLPAGVSGRVMTLLSGGIDSPVAAFMMASRGCTMDCVHFHSAPHTSLASQEKVVEIARTLAQYHGPLRLSLVPFAPVQERIVAAAPPSARVVLYRRYMGRIASELARRAGAKALVTGESLAQVASQTLSNLVTIEDAVEVPILRPLIGMTKEEIIERARAIGTFETSIQPHDDCCSFLMPRKPATHTRAYRIRAVEEELDVDAELREAIDRAEPIHVRP